MLRAAASRVPVSAALRQGRTAVAARGFSSSDDFTAELNKVLEAVQGKSVTPADLQKLAATNPSIGDALKTMQAIGLKQAEEQARASTKPPVRIAVTGAAGQIGYALLPRLASGAFLGPDQPVILHLVDLKAAMPALEGVKMELEDCAFPLLKGIVTSDDLNKGFEGVDYAYLVGSKPRGPGMERGDLLKDNGKIFTSQGAALNKVASRDVRVIVVGNPANTNALIAAHSAPDLSPEQFTAMTRLDHNRGLAQIVNKTGCAVEDIERFAIWGNHSATQYPDLSHTTINGKWAKDIIKDEKWIRDKFIPDVQQRGAAIIKARGLSSAASAASASIDHMRDWVLGSNGHWVSMAIPSDGSYGIEKGVYASYPVICANGGYSKVQDLPIDEFSASKIEASRKELFAERDAVAHLLK